MSNHDIERYDKVHVWIGTNFAPEAEYSAYFQLDYSADLDDPAYQVCGFCKDIGTRWYDEDFIGIIARRPELVSVDEILLDACVDATDLDRLKAECLRQGIDKANAIFWYSDGGTVVAEPIKPSYNGLHYIGLFEGD